MTNEPLAPIFLDNRPVLLKDPKPRVSTILSAGGQAGATEVKWLQSQTSTQGTFLRPDHTLDRTSEPTKAIYLTSLVRGPAAPVKVAIVDEDVVARPFAATRNAPPQWPMPARAKPAAARTSDEPHDAEGTEASGGSDDDPAARSGE